MGKALAMAELTTVSAGMKAADIMIITAEVKVIEAEVVCPGKYIILIEGDLSAVRASVDAVKAMFSDKLIDSFVLGNPHESIFPALYGTTDVEDKRALGVLETYSAASIIYAADIAAKTAIVNLIELRVARGMCGKSYMLLTGEVAAVESAIAKAKADVADGTMFLDSTVIANPDEKMWNTII